MCDLALIGTVVSAGASLISGINQSQQYQRQAQFADRQAEYTDRAAIAETQKGAYEARRVTEQHDRALDRMRGSYLHAGFALEGSPAAVIEDSATQASLDEQAIKYGALERATSLRAESENRRFEADQARSNASSAIFGSFLNAAGTIFGGFNQRRDFQQRRTMLLNPYVSAYG